MKLNVAVLFFGGKDDPEAVAYASRLALHPGVNVTLIRFLVSLQPSYRYNNGPSNGFSESDSLFVDVDGRDPNEDFIENIYNRFVATGMMTYLEVAVQEPKELVDALSSLNGAYTLYAVGQQVQGPMKLIATNSHWEDCPVLGSIGGLLASEFMSKGSVPVIHQYNNGTNSSVKFMSSERIWHEEHLT